MDSLSAPPVAGDSIILASRRKELVMKTALCATLTTLLLPAAAHAGGLMIPDSGTGDRIMLFSEVDGSLIDVNWIVETGSFVFTTPKEAKVIGKEIWVTDQVADAIHRFDLDRNYLSSITAHFNAGVVLDNMRGFGTDGTNVYVTCFHGTSAHRGIVIFSTDGTPTGFFQASPTATNSLFDVSVLAGNLLISNNTTDAVQRYTPAGVYLNDFATGIGDIQQADVLPDGTVIASSPIATPGVEGIYHYNADGSLIRYIDTEPIKPAFGEHVPRAGWPLQDGNYLIASSTGVYKYIVASNSFQQILAGVDAQFINPISLNDCPADINNDGQVNVTDLLAVIGAWGACTGCSADINNDGQVNVTDLLAVIGAWGPCA